MKAYVDEKVCIGCGACVFKCSEIFKKNAKGKSVAADKELTAENILDVKKAELGCPVNAIIVK